MSAGHLRLQSTIGAPSGQVKIFPTSSRFFSIVEASTGKLETSARHRATVYRLEDSPSQLLNRQIIGRCPLKSDGGRPMICRLLADFKESADFIGHRPTQARRPADARPIYTRLSAD